jgi:hypothetical protein
VSKLTNQWIELFRAGDHGDKGSFSNADLDRIVANYQPATGHEAPATIGHVKGAAPAYGWFDALKREGSLLLGKMHEVQPEFEEMVEKKLFKKRSVGLVKADNGWALHHVAFLGAQAPEIKGLADCKFEDSSTPVVEVEFQENQMANENGADGFIARLNAWFDERFPAKTATTVPSTFSEADAKRIAAEAVTAAVAPLQAKLDAQAVSFAEREGKIVTTETSARAATAIAKVKASGRWVPAFEKMGLGLVFAELAKTTTVVEFGEGTEKKSITPLDALVAFMEQLPKIVPTGVVYDGQVAKPAAGAVRFSEADHKADANSVKLANLSQEMANKEKINYGEAMGRVLALHPELALPGGATAGAV